MTRIAFIGLGVMGGPMARHLKQAGHDLTVYNRSRAKAEKWIEAYGGTLATSPADAAKEAEVVISCVGTDDDLSGVTLGRDGAFSTMTKGSLYIDHTTVSARIARQLGVEAKSRGLLIVDAPVTGGQAGAENGTLSIMCGGTEASVAAASPIIEAYSKRIVHVGGPGTGQITKMCNQIAFAGIIQSLSEAMRFAQSAELDVEKVYEAISGGAAQSWQMDNRWATMAEDKFDFGFAVDWMRKDLGLAFEEARAVGATLPITAIIDQFYADVQHMGGGRLDTSAIVKRLPKG
ncbi:NAD(P)-dependent oxidoreductase [Sphingorhabdus sp. EL138]|uniref:NAD(P)-dependent oxidoreductase n=1 Tax=Sphingorhabdus sp. EL138 TaxID=2073156 RepID=UPI0025E236A8|nr:NAD(P)-dependent oxidoreductase [Sphingorhabdus sp. EL138]